MRRTTRGTVALLLSLGAAALGGCNAILGIDAHERASDATAGNSAAGANGGVHGSEHSGGHSGNGNSGASANDTGGAGSDGNSVADDAGTLGGSAGSHDDASNLGGDVNAQGGKSSTAGTGSVNGGASVASGGDVAARGGTTSSSGGANMGSGGAALNGCEPPCSAAKVCENARCVDCRNAERSCAADGTPLLCAANAWTKQAACTGAAPLCSNGTCVGMRAIGSIVSVSGALTRSDVRLVEQTLELVAPVCSSVVGTCVVGGIRP